MFGSTGGYRNCQHCSFLFYIWQYRSKKNQAVDEEAVKENSHLDQSMYWCQFLGIEIIVQQSTMKTALIDGCSRMNIKRQSLLMYSLPSYLNVYDIMRKQSLIGDLDVCVVLNDHISIFMLMSYQETRIETS